SNIAEGTARNTSKAVLNSLDISLGESFELETQAIIANRVGLLDHKTFNEIEADISEVQRMIHGFMQTLESNPY
ncbi:MAG: four helix bundle protein, partial [Cyclobacteriaceae bacterium]|nr:four helix bundle protein [Cyclobacteriaceae bacterium]